MSTTFVPNPLSLTVPDSAFESWLRDSGHLYTLDTLSSSSSSSSAPVPSASPSLPASSNKLAPSPSNRLSSFLSALRTLTTLLSINPLAKLQTGDFSAPAPSWTKEFIAGPGDYSWPAEPSQARMRVQENVRHYVKNYMFLSFLFFACCLYKMPISLLGLLACLGIWEGVRLSIKSWELEKHPVLQQVITRVAMIIAAVVLYLCNLQFALVYATVLSYSAMLIHAFLRKLTPLSKPNGSQPLKKVQKRNVQRSIK